MGKKSGRDSVAILGGETGHWAYQRGHKGGPASG